MSQSTYQFLCTWKFVTSPLRHTLLLCETRRGFAYVSIDSYSTAYVSAIDSVDSTAFLLKTSTELPKHETFSTSHGDDSMGDQARLTANLECTQGSSVQKDFDHSVSHPMKTLELADSLVSFGKRTFFGIIFGLGRHSIS
jgi:hypothetical protein